MLPEIFGRAVSFDGGLIDCLAGGREAASPAPKDESPGGGAGEDDDA